MLARLRLALASVLQAASPVLQQSAQTEEELRDLRDALFTVKTALVEMRTRSSLVSDSCDSDDVRAPL